MRLVRDRLRLGRLVSDFFSSGRIEWGREERRKGEEEWGCNLQAWSLFSWSNLLSMLWVHVGGVYGLVV